MDPGSTVTGFGVVEGMPGGAGARLLECGVIRAGTGALPKTGAGAAGFDYTKIANDGSELPADAPLGSAAGEWACTRDNATGLVWEVKTDDGGLRDMDWL